MGHGLLPEPGVGVGPKRTPLLPEHQRDLRVAKAIGLTTDRFYALPEVEQEAQIAEWEREQGVCHIHGGPREDCADEHREWFPQRRICYAAMELAAAQWRYGQLHEDRQYHDGTFTKWAEERSVKFPYHANDGVTIWVAETDLSPHDHFLGGAKECAECSARRLAAEEPDGNEGQPSDAEQHCGGRGDSSHVTTGGAEQ